MAQEQDHEREDCQHHNQQQEQTMPDFVKVLIGGLKERHGAERSRISEVQEKVDETYRMIQAHVNQDAERDRNIDLLVQTMRTNEEEMKASIKKDMITRCLIPIYDMINDIAKSFQDDKTAKEELTILKDRVSEVLRREGVEAYNHEGERFDVEKQSASDTKPASKPEEDNKIAEVIKDGFQCKDGEIIRYEEVIVYKSQTSDES